jgi:[ribosomal protein S5]-alanine N-acetyltransferase
MTTPILTTDRLTLRPIRSSDAPRIQELFPHFELLKYMASVIPWPYPDNGAQAYLDYIQPEIESEKRFSWAITITEADDDKLIGVIELTPYNDHDHRGFWLGLPYQRKGYMTEAVVVVNDFAFESLGLERLLLGNAEGNIASHRLKEKAGAEILEIKDEDYVGGTFPSVRWQLTREQWRANRASFSR